MEEKKFWNKITWFQFACCLLVIWNHAGNAELFLGGSFPEHPLMRAEYQWTTALIRINIPCFLMISGYLFYRDFDWSKLPGKWRRRGKTLLLPYLLWNFLYYAGYLAAERLPLLGSVVDRAGIELTLSNFLYAVFYFRYNPVFWFMHQLILLVLLAPVLYLFLQNFWRGLLFLALLLLGLFRGTALPWVNLDALIYYSTAAFFAIHGKRAAEAPWTRNRAVAGVMLLGLGMMVATEYYRTYFVPSIVLYQVMAPAALWLMVDEERLGKAKPWMTCTFFIYALHFVPVRFFNKMGALLFPGNVFVGAVLFFAMPVLAVASCYQAARLLRRFSPKIWSLLNGGR